jgi:hypothetical protein
MTKFTSRADLLIAAGESIKMQEKAGIEPMCKLFGGKAQLMSFRGAPSDYELPIAVVEGKPVFVGDELYTEDGRKFIAPIGNSFGEYMTFGAGHKWSWNPPKPRTVMVELPYDYVEVHSILTCDTTLVNACRKALEEQ